MRVWGITVFTILVLGASASADVSVIERSGADLIAKRLCDLPGFQPCSTLQVELETAAANQVTAILETSYQGRSPTLIHLPGGRTLTLSNIHMRTPVCNALTEPTTNHLGQSCGTPCDVVCRTNADSKIECGIADYASCQQERAWVRGAYIQIARNAHKEVRAEVRTQGRLRLSADCDAPLGQGGYGSAFADLTQLSTQLQQLTGNATPSCQGLEAQTGVSDSELLPCYLSAVRRALELVLAEAMVCETLHRADLRWFTERVALNTLSANTIQEAVTGNACKSFWNDKSALEACVRQNYISQIQTAFQDAMGGYKDGY